MKETQVAKKKKFTHDRSQVLLNHDDPKLGASVIAMAKDPGWAKIIADNLQRSDAMLRMVEGRSA